MYCDICGKEIDKDEYHNIYIEITQKLKKRRRKVYDLELCSDCGDALLTAIELNLESMGMRAKKSKWQRW